MISRKNVLVLSITSLLLIIAIAITLRQTYADEGLQAAVEETTFLGEYFTYQGRLTDDGVPANGDYDFRSLIYNANGLVGTLLAEDIDLDVPVTNGLFTIVISADASVFNTGGKRWLEIAVRPTSGGDWTKLLPRQEIRPVPQAIYADYAKRLVNPGETVIEVSPFDAIQSDGLSSLDFAAKGTGRLEITRSAQGNAFVYIPVDVPQQILGLHQTMALKKLFFCYSGYNNGFGTISGIQRATVRQIEAMELQPNLIGEYFNTPLTDSDDCMTLTTNTPIEVTGSVWVRFEVLANNLVPLELGEIELTFVAQ
jgi:hypothetical protein